MRVLRRCSVQLDDFGFLVPLPLDMAKLDSVQGDNRIV